MAHKITFRERGHEVSRVEAFSDVIFGFALTLLVVSLEAPKTYQQMLEMLHGFLPFAICFWIFMDLWFQHHKFFRRYALQDRMTLVLNTVLLFVILFYVYPLKYMFTLSVQSFMGHSEQLPPGAARLLFTVYGAGVIAVFWVLAAMYRHAYALRDALDLNAVERIETMERVVDNFYVGVVGLISIAIAHTSWIRFAGPVYFLIGVPKTIVPTVYGIRRDRAEQQMLAGLTPEAPGTPEDRPPDAH